MRRRIMAALMTALLLVPLAACGGDAAEQAVEELRASMAEGEAELTALVTAWGQDGTRSEYTLRCVSSAQGSEVEALAPELIAGVRARLDAEGAALEYEGLILDAGVSCPWASCRILRAPPPPYPQPGRADTPQRGRHHGTAVDITLPP